MTTIPDRDKIFLLYDRPDGKRVIYLIERTELLSIKIADDLEMVEVYNVMIDKSTVFAAATIKSMLSNGAILF